MAILLKDLKFYSNEEKRFFFKKLNINFGFDFDFESKLFIKHIPTKKIFVVEKDLKKIIYENSEIISKIGLLFGLETKDGYIKPFRSGLLILGKPKYNYVILNENGIKSLINGNNLMEKDFKEKKIINKNNYIICGFEYDKKFIPLSLLKKDNYNYINLFKIDRRINYNKLF